MATSHSNRRALIPAVGYLRRSTSKQEKSLDEQRREIERYAAAHDYLIVRWYVDDAVSGDATECRKDFLAMHKAAQNSREFKVILCWDSDRFGRFNSIEAGFWIHPLMKAGVRLETVTEGPVNWDDFSGRIVAAVKQEGKHQFLLDLSRNVSRGKISNALKGRLCGQAAPYGYDRIVFDESGNLRERVRTGEKFGKARGWHVKLAPSDDPIKVATLKWLFETYANTDTGLRSLADKLNARGTPGPTGGAWYAASIKAILENSSYLGTFTWAKRREGKYFSVAASQIRERDRGEVRLSRIGKPLAVDNPREAWIVIESAHEALIDKATFDRVQEKLNDRRRGAPNAAYRTHTKANNDTYLLSGLVFCAHCGCKMHGATLKRKGHDYPKYVCSTYCRSGKNNPFGCGCHGVLQETLVATLVNKLQTTLLAGAGLKRLEASVRKRLLERQEKPKSDITVLRKRLSDLDRDISKAAENFLQAPAELLDVIGAKMSEMRRQRDQVAEEVQAAGKPNGTSNIEKSVVAVIGRLNDLNEALASADPAKVREVFRLMVERIDLRFGRLKRGKRLECPFKGGEIVLRSGDGSIFGSVSRDDRI